MLEMVDRKFVIFIGKKTINEICFEKNKKPVSFYRTLTKKYTDRFFAENKLNDTYLRKLVDVIKKDIDFMKKKGKYRLEDISIYASSEFGNTLDDNEIIYFRMKIFEETGVHTFILSKQLEQLYIRNIVPNCQCSRYVIRIMSTATLIYAMDAEGKMKDCRIEKLGTSTLSEYMGGWRKISKKLDNEMDERYISSIIDNLKNKIKLDITSYNIKSVSNTAIYLGGEIDFLNKMNYDLCENNLFDDKEHPYRISYESFYLQSISNVLSKPTSEFTMFEQGWTEGIKPCTLIALALFPILGIEIIIPSNKKELDGMLYKNFENIVITGSRKKNGNEIEKWVQHFNSRGINVYSPILDKERVADDKKSERPIKHFQAINKCDTLIVCNSCNEGYIGDATLVDIGYALARGKRIITTHKPTKDIFNVVPVEIGIYEDH